MQTAYIFKGELVNHNIIKLKEPVPFKNGEIKVTIEGTVEKVKKPRKELYGAWKGKIEISSDFNEPLDCFKDYM